MAEAISSDIRTGALKPGDKLPTESEIMARHHVSRTVVREAITYLQAERLVQTRHGIGTFVLDPPPANHGVNVAAASATTLREIQEVLELRICLETEAVWLAASRRTSEQLEQLREALGEMKKHDERSVASVEADVAFHQLIALSTGNRYFVDILRDLGHAILPRSRINPVHLAQVDPVLFFDRVNREHEDIFNAIERRDAEAARAAMRTHLSNSRERLRQAQERLETSTLPD